MNDSLPQLEAQKADLLRQLAAVGDLRRGSITATSGKCGNPNGHCAKRGDPGHGPNFRLTRNRGWSRAAKKVVIGDGAEWIRNLVETNFPGAIQIVDLYQSDHKYQDTAAGSQRAAYWVSGVRKNMRTVQGNLCSD